MNKTDLDAGENLAEIYRRAKFPVVCTSAETGSGLDELHALLRGKLSAFTGNSGVGKSSLLNRLRPGLDSLPLRSARSLAAANIPPAMWSCFPWRRILMWWIRLALPPLNWR